MSIDLTSYGVPAAQPGPAPAVAASEGQTLTLQLRIATGMRRGDPMAGLLTVRDAADDEPGGLRLRVLPAEGGPLTITF